jgi:hypothetical protein
MVRPYLPESRPGRARSTLALLLLGLAAGSSAEPPRRPTEWKFDVVRLKQTGRTIHGLLLEENEVSVKLLPVRRLPGEPTRIDPPIEYRVADIGSLEKLNPTDHAALAARVAKFQFANKRRKERTLKLDLKTVPWGADPKAGVSYTSDYFALISNARPDLVRQVAVRLEQLYAAYASYLPPRHTAGAPTTIVLVRSLAEYQQLLKKQGHRFLNSAFFDAGQNRILCASDLERLGQELEQIRKAHAQLRAQVRETRAKLERQFGPNPPQERVREIDAALVEIDSKDRKNDSKLQAETQRFFQVLYHEAFHAYLANFVYPPREADFPRWLNEGLAQVFETAALDGDELIIRRPDPDRLKRVKAAQRDQELVSFEDLLHSDAKNFLVDHASERQVSDRYYLTSWALAFYLAFDRKKLGTPELDEYVYAITNGVEPAEAFQTLVGQPLLAFEQAFHQYLQNNMRTNTGTVNR